MARLNDLRTFNDEKIKALNIKRNSGDQIMLTIDEAKDVIREIISYEMGLMTDDVVKDRKIEIEERLNFKLKQLELSVIRHVNEKIDNMTERVVSLTLNRVIEEEVDKRVELKLNEIKKSL